VERELQDGEPNKQQKERESDEVKFQYYIVYGKGKAYGSPEATTEAFKKFAEVLKKYNVELVLWGGPFGTTEDCVYVLKADVENYQSLFGKPDYMEANPIESGQRTNMVLVP